MSEHVPFGAPAVSRLLEQCSTAAAGHDAVPLLRRGAFAAGGLLLLGTLLPFAFLEVEGKAVIFVPFWAEFAWLLAGTTLCMLGVGLISLARFACRSVWLAPGVALGCAGVLPVALAMLVLGLVHGGIGVEAGVWWAAMLVAIALCGVLLAALAQPWFSSPRAWRLLMGGSAGLGVAALLLPLSPVAAGSPLTLALHALATLPWLGVSAWHGGLVASLLVLSFACALTMLLLGLLAAVVPNSLNSRGALRGTFVALWGGALTLALAGAAVWSLGLEKLAVGLTPLKLVLLAGGATLALPLGVTAWLAARRTGTAVGECSLASPPPTSPLRRVALTVAGVIVVTVLLAGLGRVVVEPKQEPWEQEALPAPLVVAPAEVARTNCLIVWCFFHAVDLVHDPAAAKPTTPAESAQR